MEFRQIYNRYPVKRRVVVNTRTERAFRGVLWVKRWGYLVLRNAEMLKEGGVMVGEGFGKEQNIAGGLAWFAMGWM